MIADSHSFTDLFGLCGAVESMGAILAQRLFPYTMRNSSIRILADKACFQTVAPLATGVVEPTRGARRDGNPYYKIVGTTPRSLSTLGGVGLGKRTRQNITQNITTVNPPYFFGIRADIVALSNATTYWI